MEGGCRRPCGWGWLNPAWLGWGAGREPRHGRVFAQQLPAPALGCWRWEVAALPLTPQLAVEAAGVIPVASGRSCQSGQAETPPHANVASRRAYATLARASTTWATLHHPWSLLWRLHPPGPCAAPAPKSPQAGQEEM